MGITRSDVEIHESVREIIKRDRRVMQLFDSVQIPNIPIGTGGYGITLRRPAPAPDSSPSKEPRTMPRASTSRKTMADPSAPKKVTTTESMSSKNQARRQSATENPSRSRIPRDLSSKATSRAPQTKGQARNQQNHRNSENLIISGNNQSREETRDEHGRSKAPRSKVPCTIKRVPNTLSQEQAKRAMLWHRRWIKFRFPVPRLTIFDDITNSYLKLVEKVEVTFLRARPRGIYSYDSTLEFRSEMESAREFHMTREDSESIKSRLRQFPAIFQSDLEVLGIPKERVFFLADLALLMTTSGWNKRLIVPRPLTVNGQRLEPRHLASVICCAPHVGEPLPPCITFKVGRIEKSQDTFDDTPVCFSLDGWAEPFHLLDWVERVFDPKNNPTGAVGKEAPRRLMMMDGYRFPISPEFFITCWLKNIFCVYHPPWGAILQSVEPWLFACIEGLYADWIVAQVEAEGDEPAGFKAESREFAAAISKFMQHSTVKKAIAVGWRKTCLFRSQGQKAICNLIDNNGAPEPTMTSSSMRNKSRLRPQTPPQRTVLNLISPEPSERTLESIPASQTQRAQCDDDGLDAFISEDTNKSQNEEYMPSQEGDFESAEKLPYDDFLLDKIPDFFHSEEDETIGRDAESSSFTAVPPHPQMHELFMAPEPNNVINDENQLDFITDEISRRPTRSVMGSSNHSSSILSDKGDEDSEWCRSHKRKMLMRFDSLVDATSPKSKKRCKSKVMEAYKEMSAAYSALERLLAARSICSGHKTQDPSPLLPVSNSNKPNSEKVGEDVESSVNHAAGNDRGQAQADGSEYGYGQVNEPSDQARLQLQQDEEEVRRKCEKKRKKRKQRREAEKRRREKEAARILEEEKLLLQEKQSLREIEESLRRLKNGRKPMSKPQSNLVDKTKGQKDSSTREDTKNSKQNKNWFEPRPQWQSRLASASRS
ncbi:hypothetical protein PEBR_07613 [Penicillium brasilianum]|uniref:DDE-1 domain-containing protein n=1 Tax=Penicillium brasilianum TaxID=104259 RepID=A0A1S9RVU0_PENBI|nr:hypothetical protein PEBR_07613 [Penicillium brasilianum]